MTKTKVPWIFFDLDDTLVDSSSAYEEALKKVGIDPHSADFLEARSAVKEILGNNNPSARNRLLYFKILKEKETSFSSSSVLNLMKDYEESLHENLKQQWQKLNRDLLFNELRKTFNLGIITNENTRTQLIKLSALDPHSQYFKFILTSEEVGVEKPHFKIFSAALERAHLDPENAIMIGDSMENDILPTEKMGWTSYHTVEFLNPKKSSARRVLQSLEELRKISKPN